MKKLHSIRDGIKYYVSVSPGDVAGFGILFNVGKIHEAANEFGVAHYLEHLIFKDSEYMTENELADEMALLGSSHNAYTTYDHTMYYADTLVDKLVPTMELFIKTLSKPKLSEDQMESERTVILEEYKSTFDDPNRLANVCLFDMVGRGTVYGHWTIGTEESIRNMTREQVVNFYNRYYNTNNITIILAVPTMEMADSVVGTIHDRLVEGFTRPETGVKVGVIPLVLNDTVEIVDESDLGFAQSTVAMTFKLFDNIKVNERSEQVLALILSGYILGHSFASRMFKKIRVEQGLAYNVYAGLTHTCNQTGLMYMMVMVDHENVGLAVNSTNEILQDMADNGVTQTELDMAKAKYLADKLFNRQSVGAKIQDIVNDIFEGIYTNYGDDIPESDQHVVDNINGISLDYMNAVIKRYFSKANTNRFMYIAK